MFICDFFRYALSLHVDVMQCFLLLLNKNDFSPFYRVILILKLSRYILSNFCLEDLIMYPPHGVGRLVKIDEQNIYGKILKLYVIKLQNSNILLRVPVDNTEKIGMRLISNKEEIEIIVSVLQSKSQYKYGAWNKKSAEYENKINSGKLTAIAEVVRDLSYHAEERNRCYGEKNIYNTALDLLASEIAIVCDVDISVAYKRIHMVLEDSISSITVFSEYDGVEEFAN